MKCTAALPFREHRQAISPAATVWMSAGSFNPTPTGPGLSARPPLTNQLSLPLKLRSTRKYKRYPCWKVLVQYLNMWVKPFNDTTAERERSREREREVWGGSWIMQKDTELPKVLTGGRQQSGSSRVFLYTCYKSELLLPWLQASDQFCCREKLHLYRTSITSGSSRDLE